MGAAVLATRWVGAASAATDDDLAFAYFGLSAELLLADFYAKAIDAGRVATEDVSTLRHGRTAAKQHARALSDLLAGAGADVPTAKDFAFQWPKAVFSESSKTLETGATILTSVQGVYQTAARPRRSRPTASSSRALPRAVHSRWPPCAPRGQSGAEPFPVALTSRPRVTLSTGISDEETGRRISSRPRRLVVAATMLAGTARAGVAADHLRRCVAHRRLPALDPAQKYSFAGSNTLETQIRNGAPADLFASAAPLNTQRLFKDGFVDKPVTFTANRLALIVPRENPADLHSVYDLGGSRRSSSSRAQAFPWAGTRARC